MQKKDKSDEEMAQINIKESTFNNSVIGNNNIVHITLKKSNTKKVVEKYPDGSIGRDVLMFGYTKYLADRYSTYRNFDLSQKNEKFNFAGFYSSIIKRFKSAGVYHIPQTRFNELVDYLQKKIDGTMLAKINKSKGILRNYDSFEEYKILNSEKK